MVVKFIAAHAPRLLGLSTDAKPATYSDSVPLPVGATIKELDTSQEFIFDGNSWVETPEL